MDKELLFKIRNQYPAGARVKLLKMDDIQAPPIGTLGTVTGVDDTGSILVNWDNGSTFNVLYDKDSCEPLVPDFTQTVLTQILNIRDLAETNMFDRLAVQRIANRLKYFELVLFTVDHKQEYSTLILTGHI